MCKWYCKAAKQGDVDAQFFIAVCYESGIGGAKSCEEAIKWYRKAAELGSSAAQRNLAYCYEKGKGIAKI